MGRRGIVLLLLAPVCSAQPTSGTAPQSPLAHNAAQALLLDGPSVVSFPLNFHGITDIRLPVVSDRARSWTLTGFLLNGMNVTDPYQPGKPLVFDDAAVEEMPVYRGAPFDAVEIRLRGAETAWHGGLATEDTGSALAGNNLPPPPDRGLVRRPEEFRWFTRDTADVSGPLGRRAEISATGTAQWASQTQPVWASRNPIGSRMLFGNARGKVRLSPRDQIDALYSGSRLDLSRGGWPAGMEALFANRVMPSFYAVDGFENLRETDHLDVVQAGWAHRIGGAGAFELRYQYSTAHLDTGYPDATRPSRIDLLASAPTESPISNFAVRTSHQFAGALKGESGLGGVRHRYMVTAGWREAQPRNRFLVPFGTDVIAAAGQPAFTVRFNTPVDTRERADAFAPYAGDTMTLRGGVTVDVAVLLNGVHSAAISWVQPSLRVGIAAPVPGFSRLLLRGSYDRTWSPLAGRYLDFGDPNSLSADVYAAGTGQLLQRFGGMYSAIASGLKRPYTDRFHVAAEFRLPRESTFAVHLVREDYKDRLAAVNVGVPASAFTPVVIRDPGPDYLPGTFDDQTLTVYAQDPATMGQDRYLLTNPAGLRELIEALTATATTHDRRLNIRVSFTAEKSFGPTNPGNSIWVNDPGVIGALYSDPNSLINATGHPFVDRAFIGKFEAVWRAPRRFLLTTSVNYMDGLPFARQLLVPGLPQGPFLSDATLRGSPEGGNRAEYVLNWNLRVSREFPALFGRVIAAADLLNVLNNGNKIVENDLSDPQFNQRPALGLLPPRMLRLSLAWRF